MNNVTKKETWVPITHGYARCSTSERRQDIDRQIRELKAAGASVIWHEFEHGDADSKEQQALMFETVKAGDTIIITEPSRLSRSVQQFCAIVDIIQTKHIRLQIIGSITIDITIHIFDGDIKLYYISVHNRYESSPENVYISCDSRQMLSNLLDSLEQTNEKYFSQDNEQQIIEQHFHGNQISITDSQVTNSNIGGESNTINVNDDKKEKTTQRTIAETIIANITSNIIWWILGAIAVVVLAYWGIGGE